jgi:hypothetical protein
MPPEAVNRRATAPLARFQMLRTVSIARVSQDVPTRPR